MGAGWPDSGQQRKLNTPRFGSWIITSNWLVGCPLHRGRPVLRSIGAIPAQDAFGYARPWLVLLGGCAYAAGCWAMASWM